MGKAVLALAILIASCARAIEVSISGMERPQAGQQLLANADGEDVSYVWSRGDYAGVFEHEPVATGTAYAPQSSDFGHWLRVTATAGKGQEASTCLWFSRLPVVYITTDDGQAVTQKNVYKGADLRIQGNAAFKEQYDGRTEIKGRGNTSWAWPKKPYKLKLDKKADLFGFGKNKHWVLISNYLDECLMRNKVPYDFSGQFGLCYQDSTWVDVVFNGKYAGVYLLCEHVRIGSTRVDIHDWEDDVEDSTDLSSISSETADITGGYLFELSAEYDSVSQFKTQTGYPVMISKPEYLKTNPDMMAYCKNYWNELDGAWNAASGRNQDGKHYTDLADFDSMVVYWLTQEIFGNCDAIWKSRFAYKQQGEKMMFGPVWDFDWGCGSAAVCTIDGLVACASRWACADTTKVDNFFLRWLTHAEFRTAACTRYWEMRTYLSALVADDGLLDEYRKYLAESGACDEALWSEQRCKSFASMTGPNRGFAVDAQAYKLFLRQRLAWLDSQMTSSEVLEASLSQNLKASMSPLWRKARTFSGVLEKDGSPVAVLDLRIGRAAAKTRKLRISGSLTGIDARKHSLSGITAQVQNDRVQVSLSVKGSKIPLQLCISSSGIEEAIWGEGALSENSTSGASLSTTTPHLRLAEVPVVGDVGELVTECLPTGEGQVFLVKNGRWVVPRGSTVRLVTNRTTGQQQLDFPAGTANLSKMRLKLTSNRRVFSGSFKIYVKTARGTRLRLKSYAVSVSGIILGGKGYGQAVCKKLGGELWEVRME